MRTGHPSVADDDIVRKTTLREVKILRQLRHPAIVSLLEAFRRKGKLYLVFEYVERNLLEVLESHPNGLSRELVRRYVFQLCTAIDWCHSHRVIHRDIKPENLLVDPSVHSLKLCDFGFARVMPAAGSSRAAALTDYVATRWYRAPELLLGSTDYSPAVDVWSIGCIMGELADGQPLFPGESDIDQLYVIQQGIGPMTSAQMERFLKAKRFRGLKFPEMRRSATLQEKYGGAVDAQGIAFMRSCLFMDPTRRMTAREAVLHPFFEGLPEEYGWVPFDPPQSSPKSGSSARKEGGATGRSDQGVRPARESSDLSTHSGAQQRSHGSRQGSQAPKVSYTLGQNEAPPVEEVPEGGSMQVQGGDAPGLGQALPSMRSDSRGGTRHEKAAGNTMFLGQAGTGAGSQMNVMRALGGSAEEAHPPHNVPSRGGGSRNGGGGPSMLRALSRGGHRSGLGSGDATPNTMGVIGPESAKPSFPLSEGGGLHSTPYTESVHEMVTASGGPSWRRGGLSTPHEGKEAGGGADEYEEDWEEGKDSGRGVNGGYTHQPVAAPAQPSGRFGAARTRGMVNAGGGSYGLGLQGGTGFGSTRTKPKGIKKPKKAGGRPTTRGAPNGRSSRGGGNTPVSSLSGASGTSGQSLSVYGGGAAGRPSTRGDIVGSRGGRTKMGSKGGSRLGGVGGQRSTPKNGSTRGGGFEMAEGGLSGLVQAGGSQAAALAVARQGGARGGAPRQFGDAGGGIPEIPPFGSRMAGGRLQPLRGGGAGNHAPGNEPDGFKKSQFYVPALPSFATGSRHK